MTVRIGDEESVLITPPKPPPVSVAASLRTLSSFAGAVTITLIVHFLVSKKEPALETRIYAVFLSAVLFIAVIPAPAQVYWPRLRRWRRRRTGPG